MAAFRLTAGGQIDRAQPVSFLWNGQSLSGFEGDTLASALLAHGERVVGRSFKFHRPRGILSAGAEEPNALVTLGQGAKLEPTARATLVRLRAGLEARAQNCWPNVHFDFGRAFDLIAPLLPAGFYNKTFMWPSWHFYEPFIRRAAGLGDALREPDPDRYEAVNITCDLLIVGSGPAGLQAARVAASSGRRVILAEQDFAFGGWLLSDECEMDGEPGDRWAAQVVRELQGKANVTLMSCTTAFGLYDHGMVGLLERLQDKQPNASVRQRYWRVRAQTVLLATGAIEQPLMFENNDTPGVMLAGAMQTYARRFAVAVGREVAFATNNDRTYLAALALAKAGIRVAAVIDSRPQSHSKLAEALRERGVDVIANATVISASGGSGLSGIRYVKLDRIDRPIKLRCDALGMSGGWSSALHLHSQARKPMRFDEERQCFLPVDDAAMTADSRAAHSANGDAAQGTAGGDTAASKPGIAANTSALITAGAVAGAHSLFAALESGHRAGLAFAGSAANAPIPSLPHVTETDLTPTVGKIRRAPQGRERKQWIDFQHDATLADVQLALREGFSSIEHVKRYTTTGMSVDQGKTSNLNALLTVAELTEQQPGVVGCTTYRPPYTPVTLGALAGRQIGALYSPRKLLPAHAQHTLLNAHWEEAGGWMRPDFYSRAGESMRDAVTREVLATRQRVGIFDASPLGKIEVSGPDAAWFIDRFYANNMSTLEVGRSRYGLMLNENGVIIDDGTVARFGAEHYVITTTSGGANRIGGWLEEWRQCEWPDKTVFITPVTTQWATVAIAGPNARDVLRKLETNINIDASAFPHLHVRAGRVCDVDARIYRVSFSGELGFEINVPARYGAALWSELLSLGRDFDITPYGLEALLLMRLEKGFLHIGTDTDGTTSPADVGWGVAASKKTADYIGKRSLSRGDNLRPDRLQLVGLIGGDIAVMTPGAHVHPADQKIGTDGWVTSAAFSPALNQPIALAMLRGGHRRIGERVILNDLGKTTTAQVTKPTFYDPKGARMHG